VPGDPGCELDSVVKDPPTTDGEKWTFLSLPGLGVRACRLRDDDFEPEPEGGEGERDFGALEGGEGDLLPSISSNT
jgi:hypothetical protein